MTRRDNQRCQLQGSVRIGRGFDMIRAFLHIGLLFLCISCEYIPEKDHFREVSPPGELADMTINLEDYHPDDTIYIWKPTFLICRIAGSVDVYHINATLDGAMVVHTYLPDGITIQLSPTSHNQGNHKLNIECITSSGTKSFADLMGYESSDTGAEWNVKIMKLEDYFSGGYRVLEDGRVEIYWNNTVLDPSRIFEYAIYNNSSGMYFNPVPGQHSMVLTDFVCGKAKYIIRTTYVDDQSRLYSYQGEILVDIPVPELYLEDVDLKNLKLAWDMPANPDACYELEINKSGYGMEYIRNITGPGVSVPRPAVGKRYDYTLKIRNKDQKPEAHGTLLRISYRHGKRVAFDNSWYYYSKPGSIVYAVSSDSMAVIDPVTLECSRRKLDTYPGRLVTSVNTTGFAIVDWEGITVYTDHHMSGKVRISLQDPYSNSYLLAGESLFVFQQDNCTVYNTISGMKVFSQEMPLLQQVKVSADGSYFAGLVSRDMFRNDVRIYKFDHSKMTEIATISSGDGLPDYYFHPDNPGRIFVLNTTNDTEVALYHLPGLTAEKKSRIPYTRVINIDPASGYVACQQEYFSVLSPQAWDKPLLETGWDEYFLSLYHSALFSSNGYAVNINQYLGR